MAQAKPATLNGAIVGQVRNFRGVQKADIKIQGIALIAGQNGAGKSSMLQAIAAAIANAPVPFFRSARPDSPLLTKKDAGVMMHDGADMGGVRIVADDGSTQIAWPSLDMKQEGDAPAASKVAAGLVTPLEMEDATRAQFFSQLLRTTPSPEELTAALCDPKQVGLDAETDADAIKAVIERVEQGGYDGAHSYFKERGAKAKGAWEHATGTRFGATKHDFKPEGWVIQLEDETEESLSERIAKAKDEVTAKTGKSAVSESEIEAAQIAAKKEPAAKAVLNSAKNAHETATLALESAAKAVDQYVVPKTISCPHCGGISLIKVVKGEAHLEQSELSPDDIADIQRQRDECMLSQEAENKRMAKANDALEAAQASYNQFKDAPGKLAKLKGQGGSASENKQALLDAQTALSTAEAHLAAYKVKQEADKLHARVLLNQKVIEVLAPEGLRKIKLTAALGDFNALLSGLCVGASFPTVELTDDLDIMFDSRPYFMCSDSQKYRAKVVVQIAVAIKESAPIAIIDGADILDADSRNGFFTLLHELSKPDTASGAPIAMLVAMTLNDIGKAPGLEKIGWGATSWIEGGVITATK